MPINAFTMLFSNAVVGVVVVVVLSGVVLDGTFLKLD